MREIKFRAWLKKEQKMVDVLSIDFQNKEISFAPLNETTREFSKLDDNTYAVLESRNFDDIELMQFTGLYDKNGKEIFEGDIVYCHFSMATKVISWRNGMFSLNEKETLYLEVKGNIYQNKNLLEEY